MEEAFLKIARQRVADCAVLHVPGKEPFAEWLTHLGLHLVVVWPCLKEEPGAAIHFTVTLARVSPRLPD